MTRFDLTRAGLDVIIQDLAHLLANPTHHDLTLAALYLLAALLVLFGHRFMWLIYAALSAVYAVGVLAEWLVS